MDKFVCHFPGCEYSTNARSKIDFHHIVPREIDPGSKVTVPLCKTHHALIYVPESKAGQHSILTESSLKILGKYRSTHGTAIHYGRQDGTDFFHSVDFRPVED